MLSLVLQLYSRNFTSKREILLLSFYENPHYFISKDEKGTVISLYRFSYFLSYLFYLLDSMRAFFFTDVMNCNYIGKQIDGISTIQKWNIQKETVKNKSLKIYLLLGHCVNQSDNGIDQRIQLCSFITVRHCYNVVRIIRSGLIHFFY